MKNFIRVFLVLGVFGFSLTALAGQREFCAGFREGYLSIKGSMALVPLCPLAPLTPLNSTDFREGIKAGIKAAS